MYQVFLKTMDITPSGLKRRGNIWLVISVQFKSVLVWWYGGASVPMVLHIWKSTITAEMHIQVLEQHMLLSRQCLFREDLNCILHLLQQHGSIVEESRCWGHFTNWKHLVYHEMERVTKIQDCWAARILYQIRMGQHFSPAAHFTDVYGLLLKEEEMLCDCEHVNMTLFQLFQAVLLPSN